MKDCTTPNLTRPARRAGRKAGARMVAACLLGLSTAACYTYSPLVTTPPPGTEVAVELNDRGRLDLVQNVGPDIALIEGLLAESSDSDLVVNVRTTAGLYGNRYRWAGEAVSLRSSHVRTLKERRFDTRRTAALVAALGAGVTVFIATRVLQGGSLGDDNDPRLPPPDLGFRIPF